MMALFMHTIVVDTNTEDAMHAGAGACSQEWLTVYQAKRHWIADHPDVVPSEIAWILTATCAYLRVRLSYDLTQQHARGFAIPDGVEAVAPALIRLAPAV